MPTRSAAVNDRAAELSQMVDSWADDNETTLAEAVGVLLLKVFELARNGETVAEEEV
jgi:hypothetical protein